MLSFIRSGFGFFCFLLGYLYVFIILKSVLLIFRNFLFMLVRSCFIKSDIGDIVEEEEL